MSDPVDASDLTYVAEAHVPSKHLAPPVEEKEVTVTPAPPVPHDDRERPTEEEEHTLRRVSDKIPWIAFSAAFVELCERFSYYGTSAVCKYYHAQSLIHTN